MVFNADKSRPSNASNASIGSFGSLAGLVAANTERDLVALFAAHEKAARDAGSLEFARAIAASRVLSLRGGKRIRPAFVAAGYLLALEVTSRRLGPEAFEPIAPAFVAFELLQTFLLAHDDWMDGDDARRGGPSLHVALGAEVCSPRDGDVLAILAGDWLHAVAYDSLFRCGVSPAALLDAGRAFAAIGRSVVHGQVEDVRRAPRTQASIEALHRLKTGSYTVEGPLRVGLALGALWAGGGASNALGDEIAAAVDAYARPLGLAFQLRDDLLGVFGDASVTGKPSGEDLRSAKATAVTVALLDSLYGERRAALERAMGGGEPLTELEFASLRALAEREVRPALEARALEYARLAKTAVDSGLWSKEASDLLSGAIDTLVRRER